MNVRSSGNHAFSALFSSKEIYHKPLAECCEETDSKPVSGIDRSLGPFFIRERVFAIGFKKEPPEEKTCDENASDN